MRERKYARLFLFVCFLVLLYFAVQVFRPFLFPIALAAILATLAYPSFDRLVVVLKGRRGWAALLTCLGITAIIVVPLVLFLALLAEEVRHVYEEFQSSLQTGAWDKLDLRNNPYSGPILNWLNRYVPLARLDLKSGFASAVQQASVFFLRHSTTLLSGLFGLVMDFFVMMFTLFFVFRDGERFAEEIKSWTPLSERQENAIVKKFREVARASVIGNLLTALAQGVAGGLVFWILGISNPLLWGVLTALFSLIPVVGTAIVWAPWALYFLISGSVGRGIALVLLEIFLVGMVDNVVRPILIEGKTEMHALVVFFSIMGGMAYFGMAGMIFGPIIVALGLTFIELCKLEFREELAKPDS